MTVARWVAIGGCETIAFSCGVALPGLDRTSLHAKATLDRWLGGGWTPGGSDAVRDLFLNTAGVGLCVFGLLLLWAGRDVAGRRAVIAANAAERLVFAALVAWYTFASGLPRVLWLAAALDLVFAAVYLRGLTRRDA